jgi:hypothetical protein
MSCLRDGLNNQAKGERNAKEAFFAYTHGSPHWFARQIAHLVARDTMATAK